jgi:hypothetical protein
MRHVSRISGSALTVAPVLALLLSAGAASAGVTVDQMPALRIKSGETLELNITDTRSALDRSGVANASCDMKLDFVDADGVVVETSFVTVAASKTISPCFLPTDGVYRAILAAPPAGRTGNAACKTKELRVLMQVLNAGGDTAFVVPAVR